MAFSKLEQTFDFILKFIHLIIPTINKVVIIVGVYYIIALLLPYDNEKIQIILSNFLGILNRHYSTTFFIITTIIASIAAITCFKSKKKLIR